MKTPRPLPLNNLLLLLAAALPLASGCTTVAPRPLAPNIVAGQHLTILSPAGQPLLRYQLAPPAETKLSIQTAGFFHPLTTPAGHPLTALAPADHLHHRGLFLAFVEMHGADDADFWGWGAHAPTNGRQIVNQSLTHTPFTTHEARFEARNHWIAGETVLLRETLEARLEVRKTLHLLDLTYTLTPESDLTLSRWAFGGFCLRLRNDGPLEYRSPSGTPSHANPNHMKPETDWPDQPWYAALITLKEGTKVGGAVINHPQNPATLWHNHPSTYMINPCITAPTELKWAKGQPITLKYRVATFDDTFPTHDLNTLAEEWAATP